MQRTTNYDLKKPDRTDAALIDDINDNMDILDEELSAPTGDSKDSTVTFTSSDMADSAVTKNTGWETVAPLASGETHESFMTKFSKIVKNLRWLYKLIGTTDISSIGDGTITKGLSSLNDSLKTCNKNWSRNTYILDGLTCSVGTLAGGYIRSGNIVFATVRVTLTQAITAGGNFVVQGLPTPSAVPNLLCATTNGNDTVAFFTHDGIVQVRTINNKASGTMITFHCVYTCVS